MHSPKIFLSQQHITKELSNAGIKYGISVGRRQPMHIVHTDCITEICEAGLHPVLVIGSANRKDNPFFDPLHDPLTPEQQHRQLTLTMGNAGLQHYTILPLEDEGHMERWSDALVALLKTHHINPSESVFHFRRKSTDVPEDNRNIHPLSSYQKPLMERGLFLWESYNRNPTHDNINATAFRTMDIDNPKCRNTIRRTLATPEYIIETSYEARRNNPDNTLLHNAPVTMMDMALERMYKELKISTAVLLHGTTCTSLPDIQKNVQRALKENNYLPDV